jgi:cbb3-type cytochrome oxidase subunit 3
VEVIFSIFFVFVFLFFYFFIFFCNGKEKMGRGHEARRGSNE